MRALLLVGLGGALGSMLRYLLAMVALQDASSKFPFGTLAANVLGCFAAGALAGLAEKSAWLDADLRLFLFVGLLGGFTTFSAFGLETLTLLRRGDTTLAFAYAAGSVLIGLAAAWLGLRLGLR